MIPIFGNSLGDEELAAVRRVFESGWLAKGEQCSAFEREFAEHLNARHTLLFNSCTSATYATLAALGIQAGDEVIVPSIQFVGVANAVVQAGAVPVFADVDPLTLNLLPAEVERLRTPRTKAVFMLHYGGHPAAMDQLYSVCQGIYILEDAANAVASKWNGQACGTLGDAGVWSFDAMKILVMSDGGALYMKDEAAHQRAMRFRYFGMPIQGATGSDIAKSQGSHWWKIDVEFASGRYISNDLLAAIGREQLRKVPDFVQRRKSVWYRYQQSLEDIGDITLPPEPLPNCESSYYLFWIQTERRDELASYLYQNDVYTTFRYYPLHLVRFYGSSQSLKNSEEISQRCLCLPIHQNLSDSNVDCIIGLIKSFYSKVG